MIVFVGDKPSKKNKDPDIPFVGTQSYKRLLEWIWEMDIDISYTRMYNKNDVCLAIRYGDIPTDAKFIVLGTKAKETIEDFSIRRVNLDYFKLPHPSPRNFKTNDKKWLKKELKKCKLWLEGQNDISHD